MSQEEEKVLKDLVTHCLATKGFLGKIQAEIRAGVFVALEEKDVLKDILINKPLKDFIETTHGALVISLVREFLEFFNLQFTNMVFDPETHAGIDYKFEGRKKLAKDMNLAFDDSNTPLLGLLLQSLGSSDNRMNVSNAAMNGLGSMEKLTSYINVENESLDLNDSLDVDHDIQGSVIRHNEDNHEKSNEQLSDETPEKILSHSKDIPQTSLSSLPPLNVTKFQQADDATSKFDKQLQELLQFEPDGGDAQYEEDFVSSGSEKKDKADSTESEIEEELPTNSNHSDGDDVTIDMTVSKASGHGDYTENISNS